MEPNVDITVARDIDSGQIADRRVGAPIALGECCITNRSIRAASGVGRERKSSNGRVCTTAVSANRGVACERTKTERRVLGASGVGSERS